MRLVGSGSGSVASWLLILGGIYGQKNSITTIDGLQIDIISPIECIRKTQNGDWIQVHYNGTLEDGTTFDSSYKRNSPFRFQLGAGRVIAGWDKGLLDMCIGEERRLVIPPEMAYGSRGVGIIPPSSTLGTLQTIPLLYVILTSTLQSLGPSSWP